MDPIRAARPLNPQHTLLWQTVIDIVFLLSAIAIALIDRQLQTPAKPGVKAVH